jgi:hypothetical protein
MPRLEAPHPPAWPAIVARTEFGNPEDRYLQLSPLADAVWVADPASATSFASMREATRMATRLPAALRAFGLPRYSEMALAGAH